MLVEETLSVRRFTILHFCDFLFVLYPPARVFLWVATAHRACLPLYETNGPF